jgi:hypothetical protein
MNDDFLDFIRLLNRHKVEFILVGGYAYMFNVEARFTGDIDFWVRPTRENLERLQAAAFEFIGVLGSRHLGKSLGKSRQTQALRRT